MNGRIEELAAPAFQFAMDNAAKLKVNFYTAYTEKLAELIVRECLDMIYNNNIEDGDRALGAVADMISKRFGVEWHFRS